MEPVLAALLTAAWAFPGFVAGLWVAPRLRPLGVRLAPFAALPALLLALLAGGRDGTLVQSSWPLLFSGLHLALDATGRAFLLPTALLWSAAGLYARSYHARDARRGALFSFFALTMAGNLGLILAADSLTFYLFFVLMTFAAYGLVVHQGDGEARRAGRVYIVLAVAGELALLVGLLGLGALAGGALRFGEPLESVWAQLAAGGSSPGAAALGLLLALGFAVKGGLAPLHVWLPLAHPVAPTPASALLSGALIKAGLLGWLRFLPAGAAPPAAVHFLLGAGLLSAFYGVLVGLGQTQPKTILAYSSVSQMGYLAIGTGLLLAEGAPSDLALATVLLYALHHALAKAALFLSVGVVERTTLLARRRLASSLALLPALALCGLPATGGALAKVALKDGLAASGLVGADLAAAALFLGSLGTTLLMARWWTVLARGPRGCAADSADGAGLWLPWLALVVLGAAGPLWFPRILPAPQGGWGAAVAAGWPAALAPLLVGVACVWAVSRSPALARTLGRLAVPPGDVLVPIERLLAARPRFDQEAWTGAVARLVLRVGDLRVPLEHLLRRFAREDLRGMWGPVLGASLVGLVAALVLAAGLAGE